MIKQETKDKIAVGAKVGVIGGAIGVGVAAQHPDVQRWADQKTNEAYKRKMGGQPDEMGGSMEEKLERLAKRPGTPEEGAAAQAKLNEIRNRKAGKTGESFAQGLFKKGRGIFKEKKAAFDDFLTKFRPRQVVGELANLSARDALNAILNFETQDGHHRIKGTLGGLAASQAVPIIGSGAAFGGIYATKSNSPASEAINQSLHKEAARMNIPVVESKNPASPAFYWKNPTGNSGVAKYVRAARKEAFGTDAAEGIGVGKGIHPGAFAHELGHAQQPGYLKFPGAHQIGQIAPAIGALTASFTGNQKTAKKAAITGTALSLPMVASEISASIRGSKLMSKAGAKGLNKLVPGIGLPSYLAAAAAPGVAYEVKKHLGGYKKPLQPATNMSARDALDEIISFTAPRYPVIRTTGGVSAGDFSALKASNAARIAGYDNPLKDAHSGEFLRRMRLRATAALGKVKPGLIPNGSFKVPLSAREELIELASYGGWSAEPAESYHSPTGETLGIRYRGKKEPGVKAHFKRAAGAYTGGILGAGTLVADTIIHPRALGRNARRAEKIAATAVNAAAGGILGGTAGAIPDLYRRNSAIKKSIISRAESDREDITKKVKTVLASMKSQQVGMSAKDELIQLKSVDLGYSDALPPGSSNGMTAEQAGPAKKCYPTFYINDCEQDLDMPSEGEARIQYRIKSKTVRRNEIGKRSYSADLEIQNIEPIENEDEVEEGESKEGLPAQTDIAAKLDEIRSELKHHDKMKLSARDELHGIIALNVAEGGERVGEGISSAIKKIMGNLDRNIPARKKIINQSHKIAGEADEAFINKIRSRSQQTSFSVGGEGEKVETGAMGVIKKLMSKFKGSAPAPIPRSTVGAGYHPTLGPRTGVPAKGWYKERGDMSYRSELAGIINLADPRPRNPQGEFTQQEGGPNPNEVDIVYKRNTMAQNLAGGAVAGVGAAAGGGAVKALWSKLRKAKAVA